MQLFGHFDIGLLGIGTGLKHKAQNSGDRPIEFGMDFLPDRAGIVNRTRQQRVGQHRQTQLGGALADLFGNHIRALGHHTRSRAVFEVIAQGHGKMCRIGQHHLCLVEIDDRATFG